jgi:orotidine-5'-phosphate decarboxylase
LKCEVSQTLTTTALGPYIAVVKTHIDIILDFSAETVKGLQDLAEKHSFLLFEDRKFVDIGNTVKMQYDGAQQIVHWAHIVNACILAGDGTIHGLQQTTEDLKLDENRGLLLLAEMTSKGSLATGDWTTTCVRFARQNYNFVIGFVCNSKLTDLADGSGQDFVTFTTGINRSVSGDKLGQQYRTPVEAIEEGSDIIIVGRGIYEAENPIETAKLYQKEAWDAYEALI